MLQQKKEKAEQIAETASKEKAIDDSDEVMEVEDENMPCFTSIS